MAGFIERMLRAARLDVHLYEEVEADKSAMPQALGVVVLSSVAAGVGSVGIGGMTPGVILMGIITALAGWFTLEKRTKTRERGA